MQHWWIHTQDKPGLLWTFLRHFEGMGRVSFEGDLERPALAEIPGASVLETEVLRRQTLAPRLDFVIVQVTADTIPILQNRLCVPGIFNQGGALIHVQIEHDGRLVFGAYDNFHKDCVIAYEPTPESLLKELQVKGIIRSYGVTA